MLAVMLASRRVIPFDAEPNSGCADDLTDEADGTDRAVV
jgi:hypothetical protein